MNRPPIDRLAREPELDSDQTSLLLRIGLIVAGGVIAAVASSIPAALRSVEELSAARALEQWVVLSALGTPLGVAAVALLARARVGLKLLMGDRGRLLAVGVLWWCVIELGLLSVFGALLRKTTHHTGLAGVTFAAFAIITGLLVAIFARRTTMTLVRGGRSIERIGLGIAGGAALVVLLLVALRTSRAKDLHTAAGLLDSLAFVITSTISSSKIFGRFRPMAIAGFPIAILVIMVGLTTLRFDPKLRDALLETAPIHSLMIQLFGG
jgi:hypothetical protein